MSGELRTSSNLIPRRTHMRYVMLISVFAFLALSLFLSFFFPYYREADDVGKLYNANLLWFVPAGLFFGLLFGIVINRWMLVIYLKGPAEDVPLSFAARAGRFISGWRFPLYIILIACLYVIAIGSRQTYYYSAINYRVPGLDVSRSEVIRHWTFRYISANPDPKYILTLAALDFTDNDIKIKEGVIYEFHKYNNKETLCLLSNILLHDKEPENRLNAARALYEIKNRESIPTIYRAFLNETDIETRKEIMGCLCHFGDNSLVIPLIQELKNNESVAVRVQSAIVLGGFGNELAIQPLSSALSEDESEHVRAMAGVSLRRFQLGNIAVTIPAEPLLDILKNGKNQFNRMWAAALLHRTGNESAIEPLIHALENDESKHVRSSAACSLGWFGTEKAIEAMKKALKNDTDPWVTEAVTAYLEHAKEREKEKEAK